MTEPVRWLWDQVFANPVLVRIVQSGSRRTRHQWVRSGYVGALVGLVVVGLLSGEGLRAEINVTELAKSGAWLFRLISYGQVVLVCLLAPLFMAGAIAQERAGRTYDILLTTPLSNLQIVLGSLFGRLFFIFALLASGLPLFAVVLIFGGLPGEAVFVSFAVSALSALTVGSVAVALSVLRAGGRKHVLIFVVAVSGYLVAVYAADYFVLRRIAPAAAVGAPAANRAAWVAPHAAGGGGQTTWLTPFHPLLTLEASMNSASYQVPAAESLRHRGAPARLLLGRPFAAFAAMSLGLSACLIVWSTAVMRRIGQRGGGSVWRRLRAGLWRPEAASPDGVVVRRRLRQVWSNPIAWREAQTRGNRPLSVLLRVLFLGACLLAGVWLLVGYHRGSLPVIADPAGRGVLPQHRAFQALLLILLLVELAVVVMVAIYMSAGSISREREEGTLDLILTTPVEPKQYVWGKLRGLTTFLMLLLAAPILTLAVVAGYAAVGRSLSWPTAMVEHTHIAAGGRLVRQAVPLLQWEAPVLLALVIVPFTAMCVTIGMSWSLKARGVLGSVTPALGVVGCLLLVSGFCGLNAAKGLEHVGPFLNAFSPVTHLMVLLNPWDHAAGFGDDPATGRLWLAAGSATAGAVYGLVVYLTLQTLVGSFDQTVRRLSGAG